MSDYTKLVDFAVKDGYVVGTAAKRIKGTEINTEFQNISLSIATKANKNNAVLSGTPTAPTAAATVANNQLATTSYTTSAITAATTVAVINNIAYPVGSVYTSVVATNPSILLGIGTWVAFGAGRTLVGIDTTDILFDVVEEIGGDKTHIISEAELPTHSHTVFSDETVAPSTTASNITATSAVAKSTGQSASYEGYITREGAYAATLGKSSEVGSGTAHNNLQPYIVVYFWKRTV